MDPRIRDVAVSGAKRPPWKAIALCVAFTTIGFAWWKSRPSLGRVALIGDSYATGLGLELSRTLSDFRYEGHVGTGTWQWAHHTGCGQCGDWLTAFRPAIVLVSLGVNDGNAPNRATYEAIVQALQGVGARVVWIEPPAGVSTPSRAVIASLDVQKIPATTTPLSADGLHPASYGSWAQEIVKILRGA